MSSVIAFGKLGTSYGYYSTCYSPWVLSTIQTKSLVYKLGAIQLDTIEFSFSSIDGYVLMLDKITGLGIYAPKVYVIITNSTFKKYLCVFV